MIGGKSAIIGGGPAGMMAAWALAEKGPVDLYEKGKMPGRKFLVAGKGGFNLSNDLQGLALRQKYRPEGFLDGALKAFGSADTRAWLADLGIPTFVGSSGRIFPERGIKPAQVLARIRQSLAERGVRTHLRHRFVGFDDEARPRIQNASGTFVPQAERYVFALGGASWSVTGSDGSWLPHFAALGVPCRPFRSSNCGLELDWPPGLVERHAGQPLKNVAFQLGGIRLKGEALITHYGLEGNVIYPLSALVRQALETQSPPVTVYLDSKPQMDAEALRRRLGRQPVRSKNYGKILRLPPAALAVIKAFSPKEAYLDNDSFLRWVKSCPLPVKGLRPLEEAISTVGGICCDALSPDFSLRDYPHLYAIGEMLDWDAPTGGFLLQACLASGYFLGE